MQCRPLGRKSLVISLKPGIFDGLVADTGLLFEKAVGAGSARQTRKAATKGQADVERLFALRAQLATADSVQEDTKLTAKELTAARNAAHKRVKDAIAAIVGAAELAFVEDPARVARYRALVPTKSAVKKAPAPVA